jgi:hypothetical protein
VVIASSGRCIREATQLPRRRDGRSQAPSDAKRRRRNRTRRPDFQLSNRLNPVAARGRRVVPNQNPACTFVHTVRHLSNYALGTGALASHHLLASSAGFLLSVEGGGCFLAEQPPSRFLSFAAKCPYTIAIRGSIGTCAIRPNHLWHVSARPGFLWKTPMAWCCASGAVNAGAGTSSPGSLSTPSASVGRPSRKRDRRASGPPGGLD